MKKGMTSLIKLEEALREDIILKTFGYKFKYDEFLNQISIDYKNEYTGLIVTSYKQNTFELAFFNRIGIEPITQNQVLNILKNMILL